VNLKAICPRFWDFFFGVGFAASEATMVALNAASEDGGELMETLVRSQFGRVYHCDRLLV
jgi:hypothetical protein